MNFDVMNLMYTLWSLIIRLLVCIYVSHRNKGTNYTRKEKQLFNKKETEWSQPGSTVNIINRDTKARQFLRRLKYLLCPTGTNSIESVVWHRSNEIIRYSKL